MNFNFNCVVIINVAKRVIHCFIVYLLQMLAMIILLLLYMSLSELLSKVASRSIIDYIKETGFYRKLLSACVFR